MHRFFAPPENFQSVSVTLGETEMRHLRDVLRLGAGELVRVFDGEGREFECEILATGKRSAELSIEREITASAPESPLRLTIAAAITPAEKFDLVVQKSVELGVAHFVPLITARCEVKVKDGGKRLERWRRIAFEAAKQCGRAKLMTIGEVTDFSEFVRETRDPLVIFSERDGSGFDSIETEGRLAAIYGPKGGWDDRELETARDAGAFVVTFGGRILRAETAAIGITAILQHRFGDMR
jgi:16S rRNA (uracil1498-N3)-methyltransferase